MRDCNARSPSFVVADPVASNASRRLFCICEFANNREGGVDAR